MTYSIAHTLFDSLVDALCGQSKPNRRPALPGKQEPPICKHRRAFASSGSTVRIEPLAKPRWSRSTLWALLARESL